VLVAVLVGVFVDGTDVFVAVLVAVLVGVAVDGTDVFVAVLVGVFVAVAVLVGVAVRRISPMRSATN